MFFHSTRSFSPNGVSSASSRPEGLRDLPGIRVDNPVVERPTTIRLADCDGQRNAARLLLNRMYSWRGYGDQHAIAATPSHTTFTASSDTGDMVGTITLAIDSHEGLAIDSLFKPIIDTYRSQPGAHVCELTKFAFDQGTQSKAVLASLFHLIFIYGNREYGCTDLFIEVNPRHVRFYEIMLGFRRLGELRTNESVKAPSQLMWLSVAGIRDSIDRYAGLGDHGGSRSLYPYFFSPKEEEGLYSRMVSTRDQRRSEQRVIRVREGWRAFWARSDRTFTNGLAFRTTGSRAARQASVTGLNASPALDRSPSHR